MGHKCLHATAQRLTRTYLLNRFVLANGAAARKIVVCYHPEKNIDVLLYLRHLRTHLKERAMPKLSRDSFHVVAIGSYLPQSNALPYLRRQGLELVA